MTTPSKSSCTGKGVATDWGTTPLYKEGALARAMLLSSNRDLRQAH